MQPEPRCPLRVLWVDPIGTDAWGPVTVAALDEVRRPDTEVTFVALAEGLPVDLSYHAAEALVVADLVRIAHWASERFDAIILGCFFDLGVREAREVSGRAAVVGPCDAATMLARQLGERFSVLVGRRKWVPTVENRIRALGHAHALVSTRVLEVGVAEFEDDHDRAFERMVEEGRAAIEDDGAEVLVIGCTADCRSFRRLQEVLGVPVIDAVVAPFKVAELMAEAGRRLGWSPSRVGDGEPPPRAVLERWKGFSDEPPVGAVYRGATAEPSTDAS